MSVPSFITIEEVHETPLPYEEAPDGARPIVYLEYGSSRRPITNAGKLDRLQEDLRAAPTFDTTRTLGGPLHRYWHAVKPAEALEVLDQHIAGDHRAARRESKEENDMLDQTNCYVCNEAFELASEDGQSLPHYERIVSLTGIPLHAACAPTLADELDAVWEHTDELIAKFL